MKKVPDLLTQRAGGIVRMLKGKLIYFFAGLLPDRSCPGHEKRAPSKRSCLPTYTQDSTCPNYSHTSGRGEEMTHQLGKHHHHHLMEQMIKKTTTKQKKTSVLVHCKSIKAATVPCNPQAALGL